MKYMLGIESTAHTFGVAVLNFDGEILSNVKDAYTTEKGGMIPMEVRKHHVEVADRLFEEALEEAGIGKEQIEAIAFSNAPGLAPCLLEGMKFAKETAKDLGVPLVMVNHCVAHLEIGESIGAKDPVMLYASGANTQVIAYAPEGVPPAQMASASADKVGYAGKYRVFGETLDLGVGNFIDTIGRFMGLGFPAGPKIEKLAEECTNKDVLIDLPYSIKGMDVAFSGLQTKIRNFIDARKGVPSLEDSSNLDIKTGKKTYTNEEIAYSMQEVVFAMLVEAAERALAHTGKKELLLGGGVACNSRLQEMCKIMCAERGVKYFCPDRSLLVDNAGMIGYLGLKMYKAGLGKDIADVDIAPRERTDDVEVSWK